MLLLRSLLACIAAIAIVAAPANAADDANDNPALPKIILVGDSIRLSYAPTVAKLLEGKATVVSPKPNGGDSNNVLKNLDAWVIQAKPTVVQFNCGIHDTKKFKATGNFQVSPEQYEQNLRDIIERIRQETDAVVLFALTTPILDDRAAETRRERDYELLDASVQEYNAIAIKVMKELKVPVTDLHAVIANPKEPLKPQDLIVNDGVHLTHAARELVGTTVAEFVGSHLAKP